MGRHKEETVQTTLKLSLDNSFLKFYLTKQIAWFIIVLNSKSYTKNTFCLGESPLNSACRIIQNEYFV